MKTIILQDGYNGHTIECIYKPIEIDNTCVKLRVLGSSYLFRWVSVKEWEMSK